MRKRRRLEMKHLSLIILAVFVCSLLPHQAAMAQEVKIGYVDMVKIWAEFKESIEANEVFKKEVEVHKKKLSEMELELAQMREEIQSQSLMLSEEKLAEIKLDYEQKAKAFQQYYNDIFGEGGEIERRDKELSQPVVEKFNAAIDKIATDEGYSLILDSSQATVVWAKGTIDLTGRVLEFLSQQMETVE
jgi:outer membrane protein